MALEQKYIEGSNLMQIDVDVERWLTKNYSEIKWEILDIISYAKKVSEEYIPNTYGVVIPMNEYNKPDMFLAVEIMFENESDMYVVDIVNIDLDDYLDLINMNMQIIPTNKIE